MNNLLILKFLILNNELLKIYINNAELKEFSLAKLFKKFLISILEGTKIH